MKQFFTLTILSIFLCIQPALAEIAIVRHIAPESKTDERNLYFIALLEMALEKTVATHGAYKLEESSTQMQQGRAIKNLTKDLLIDVVWTMTSNSREQELLAVRIPLLKGLSGHRVFLIRKEDKNKFRSINSLDDLKKLTAGQGHDWPDTEILRANGLTVIDSHTYEGLFSMLEKKRFDYFPRSISEASNEQKLRNNLAIEETLLLRYPAATYFFVKKDNLKLADRIERGLRLAIEDGSFDRLFYRHRGNRGIFELKAEQHRKIFILHNPFLPVDTPLGESKLWYYN